MAGAAIVTHERAFELRFIIAEHGFVVYVDGKFMHTYPHRIELTEGQRLYCVVANRGDWEEVECVVLRRVCWSSYKAFEKKPAGAAGAAGAGAGTAGAGQ